MINTNKKNMRVMMTKKERIREELFEAFECLYLNMTYDCLKELDREDIEVDSDCEGCVNHFSNVFLREIISGERDWDYIYKEAKDLAANLIVENDYNSEDGPFDAEILELYRKLKDLDSKQILDLYDTQIEKLNDLYNDFKDFIDTEEHEE